MEGDVQVLISPAAVDDRRGTDNGRTGRSRDLNRLACRLSGRHYIFNDEGGAKATRHIPNAFSVSAW